MFSDFKIVLDPPLRGFYCYDDDVSGRVIFESSHEEKICWVYIFFQGLVHAQIVYRECTEYSIDNPYHRRHYGSSEKQKEVLIQTHLKLYESNEKLRKKVRYEWPFTFSFQAERRGDTLPSSGKYSLTFDQNYLSSVEYKVVVIGGQIGQMDDHIRSMLNPEDPRYLEEQYVRSAGFFTKLKDKIGGAIEQELRFVQIRPDKPLDQSLAKPNSAELNIPSHQLPFLMDSASYDDFEMRPDNYTCDLNIQIPRNILIGETFPILLSASCKSDLWNRNPPTIMLTSLKIGAWIKDITTINGRSDEELKLHPILERKHLKIPLSAEGVDVGTIYGCRLAGDEIVPSFHIGSLDRRYDFHLELTVEIGRKSYPILFPVAIEGQVLSPLFATGRQPFEIEILKHKKKPQEHLDRPIAPRDATTIKLQRTHIGSLSQWVEGKGGPDQHSVMEAAVALCRILSEAGVQYSFPGGPVVELLPYIAYEESFIPSSDDVGKLHRLFTQEGSPFQVLAVNEKSGTDIDFLFEDDKNKGSGVLVSFSDMKDAKDEIEPDDSKVKKKFQNAATTINPIALFNHRLSTIAEHNGFDSVGLDDINILTQTFTRELRQHKKEINPKYAREALDKNSDLEISFTAIGISLKIGKAKLHSHRDEELPQYELEAGNRGMREVRNQVGKMNLKDTK